MATRHCFNPTQLKIVRTARERAEHLVTNYYRVAPREWRQMRYEVKTLRSLESSEVTDFALAHTVCYEFKRQAGPLVLESGELYRICLQDHRILHTIEDLRARLDALLTYVLTHELVHVVRFGQQLERVDMPEEFRLREEQRVEKTTRAILASAADPELDRILSSRVAQVYEASGPMHAHAAASLKAAN